MPHVLTPGNVSIWYITNSPSGDIDTFDPFKPTIMLLHPLYLDSVWSRAQFNDQRLRRKYNMIGMDFRRCGKSSAPPSGGHDCWVDAADIAFVQYTLGLPPFHIFAAENMSVCAALRFAILFPERCISLTLCNIPPPEELEWVRKAYVDLLKIWSFPKDAEQFETACMELSYYMLGNNPEPNLRDEIIAHWQMHYAPFNRSRVVEIVNVGLDRRALTDRELEAVQVPVLIIHGDKTEVHPVECAEELASKLPNIPGGPKLFIVKGGPEYITIVPYCSSVINRVFAAFISELPSKFPASAIYSTYSTPPPSPLHPALRSRGPSIPPLPQQYSSTPLHTFALPSSLDPEELAKRLHEREERMKEALGLLADFAGDETIAMRDPGLADSFTRADEETTKRHWEMIKTFREGEEMAVSMLGIDGRPLRKFSERPTDHPENWHAHQAPPDMLNRSEVTLTEVTEVQ